MKQKPIYTIPGFIEACDQGIRGTTTHTDLITINSTDKIAEERAAMIDRRQAYENARKDLHTARRLFDEHAMRCRKAMLLARDILKPHMGNGYTQVWDSVGLVRSLRIPHRASGIQSLLPSFVSYFTANPAHENAALNITAEAFQNLRDEMLLLMKSVLNGKVAVAQLLRERNAAIAAVRKRIRDLFGELKMVLDPLDPRWEAFGFYRPGYVKRERKAEKKEAMEESKPTGEPTAAPTEPEPPVESLQTEPSLEPSPCEPATNLDSSTVHCVVNSELEHSGAIAPANTPTLQHNATMQRCNHSTM